MTAKQIFEYALVELNKKEAPSLLLEDYNYFINKAVNQYVNKVYNKYDLNQQLTDDLRVLKSTVTLTPSVETGFSSDSLLSKVYEVDLPDDYMHVLNCVVEYDVNQTYKCYESGTKVHFGARRLTADMYSQIINNYFLRPSYRNPYYYINNVTTSTTYPTTDDQVEIDYTPLGTEPVPENVEKVGLKRYGNKAKVRMEIRYGKDNSLFTLSKIYLDYVKSPQFIRLTQEQVDEVADNSQIVEFPDYVAQEIVNELIMLLLENASDPRLQTNIPISESVANPIPQQQQPQQRR